MYKTLTSILLLAAGFVASATIWAQTAMQQTGSGTASGTYQVAPRDPALKPVFEEFGGKPGLVALMNDFMDNLMADPVTRPFFQNADREHIKAELVDQFCVILDGPCTYTGMDMTTAHRGMNVDHADFNALVEDLQKAMNKHDIPFRAQNKLLAKLAPMHRQIITKP
jgi:hemoglobin